MLSPPPPPSCPQPFPRKKEIDHFPRLVTEYIHSIFILFSFAKIVSSRVYAKIYRLPLCISMHFSRAICTNSLRGEGGFLISLGTQSQ